MVPLIEQHIELDLICHPCNFMSFSLEKELSLEYIVALPLPSSLIDVYIIMPLMMRMNVYEKTTLLSLTLVTIP